MSKLTGAKIISEVEKGNIFIDPFDISRVNPNSYNLTLSNKLKVYKNQTLDMNTHNEVIELIIPETGLTLDPRTLYLGCTNESTGTDKYVPMIDGRSSTGRLGLYVHVTAGFGDIGFNGVWTLEISVIQPLKIYPNTEICQVSFETIEGDILPEYLYRGKYQNQKEAIESRFFMDINKRG